MRNVQQYWECPSCGHVNDGMFCIECGSLRPGCVKAAQVESFPQKTDNSTPMPNEDKWRCYICGHENTERFCLFCGQSRDNNDKIVIPDPQAFTAFPPIVPNMMPARGMMCDIPNMTPPDPNSAEPWSCPNCEHNNKGGEYCFNSGMPNPNVPKKDNNWICPDCGMKVSGAPFCPECGKKKPEAE